MIDAGAEADDIIARLRQRMHHPRQFLGRRQHQGVAMAVGGDRRRQRRLVDALDRRFAGGIDVGDDHRVGVVEAGGEGSNSDCSRV